MLQTLTKPCTVCGAVIKLLYIDSKLVHVAHAGCERPAAEMLVDVPRFLGTIRAE